MGEELPIGTIVGGRYRIERLLGRGGMGVVYLAQHTSLHRPFALKMLLAHAASDGPAVARFLQEARAAASIGHPGIVEVFDLSQPGEIPFLAMEKLEGETLSARIARGPLTPAALLEIAIPLCDAVGAAHAHGIVHRDLKPDNVFIAQPGARVKVLDFGIAKLATPTFDLGLTQAGQVLGTPNYMSPEQMRGRADARTDVYALATIFYECLVGALPFQATSITELIAKITADPAPPIVRADIPAPLAALIAACLEKDPARRPPDARALGDWLRATHRPIETTKPTVFAAQTAPMTRRSPAFALVWAALVIPMLAILGAAVAAIAWWALPHGPPAREPRRVAEAPPAEPPAEPPEEPPAEQPDPPTRRAGPLTITIEAPVEQAEVDHAALLAATSPVERQCIVAHAAHVVRARDEYYAWARSGPAEARQIGSVTALDDTGEACERAVAATAHTRGLEELRSEAERYARALRALAPLVNEASAYYANRTYETDGMQRGRELHEVLGLAFNEFFPAEHSLRDALHSVLRIERDERLKTRDLPARTAHAFQLKASILAWIARQIEVTDRGLMYGPSHTYDAIDEVEQAHRELGEVDAAYRAQADAFLASALALRARFRRGRPVPRRDPTGSPVRIVAAYETLLVVYYDSTGG